MDSLWQYQKQQLAKRYQKTHFRVISGIRRGIVQNKLRSIEVAASKISRDMSMAPKVVAHLNAAFSSTTIVFRWYSDRQPGSGTLLIRSESVGLIIQTSPAVLAEGKIMAQGAGEECLSVSPELALMLLSALSFAS